MFCRTRIRPTTDKYPQVGFRCFVERKVVNLKTILFRKFNGQIPPCVYFRDVNAKHRGFANKLLRQVFGAWEFCFSFRADNFTQRTFPRLTVWSLTREQNARRTILRFSTVLLSISAESFTEKQLRGECSHSARQNIENKDFIDNNNDRNKCQALTSATRQVRLQWFSVGIFPLRLLLGLTGNRPKSAPACSFLR